MKFGLIGEHVARSHSKTIHERLAGYEYELRSISRDDAEDLLKKGDFLGINVTMPYKLTVMPYCAELSDAARAIGSVNTVVKRDDGTFFGDNTDCAGFLYLARSVGISFKGKKVLVCGSGGTSRTAVYAARESGAREVVVVSRSGDETYDGVHERHADAQIIVNTTPLGSALSGQADGKAIELKPFAHLEGVLDAVYDPLRSRLVIEAEELGVRCGGGLMMLVAQAKYAAERFARTKIPDARIDEIERDLRREISNMVFIGMSGTGKTTIARECAKVLGRKLVDVDDEIVRRAGTPIPEIFASRGEAAFRDIESEAIAELAPQKGLVIATGGGAIMRAENVGALRANGVLIRLTRPIDRLATDGRPMLDKTSASELARAREPFYAAAADAVVENSGTIKDARDRAIAAWRDR